jgi:hypothetical protein
MGDGVGEEVAQDLADALAVGVDRRQVGREGGRETQALVAGARAEDRHGLLDDLGEGDRAAVEGESAGLGQRELLEVVDQPAEGSDSS